MDPGGGDCELPVVGIELAPVIAADQRLPTDLAELLRILLLDLAPPAMPFLPPLLHGTVWVRPLGSWDPGDATRDSTSRLDPRGEIVAEERHAGMHPDEALTEVREEPCTPRHLE